MSASGSAVWVSVLCVALGGALGSVLRFMVSQWCAQRFGDGFGWGTLVVNLVGSMVFGLLWGLGPTLSAPVWLRALLFSGVLGGLTTFSSFMFDVARTLETGRTDLALGNLFGQTVLGLGFIILGLVLGRALGPFMLGR